MRRPAPLSHGLWLGLLAVATSACGPDTARTPTEPPLAPREAQTPDGPPPTSDGAEPDLTTLVRLVPNEGETRLPRLEPPFSAFETAVAARRFEWSRTTPVADRDEHGNPALYYVEVLVRDRANMAELDALGVPYDALPLFDEELARWDGQLGVIEFASAPQGAFAFALLPGAAYNAIREEALAGEPLFDAVVLRPAPESVGLPSGALSYGELVARGHRWETTEDASTTSSGAPVGVVRRPLFGRVVRRVRRAIEGAVNGIRRGFAEIREGLGGERDFTMRLWPLNTDPAFGLNEPIRQAWGVDAGHPIGLEGVSVRVNANLGQNARRTDRYGLVRMTLPRVRRARVFVRLQNRAAQMTAGAFWDHRIKVYDGDAPAGWWHITAHLRDPDVNILTQFTDSWRFTTQVLGHTPRSALVRTGPVVDAVAPNAIAPCLGSFSLGALSFGDGRGWSTLASNLLAVFMDDDIVIPRGAGGRSRIVPTHEYGHFVMCTLLAREGASAMARAWGEVWQDTLLQQGPDEGGEAGIVAEGWADFFAMQVAGGVSYFALSGSQPIGSGAVCDARFQATGFPCAEDNIGGPPRSPGGQETQFGDARAEAIAMIATTLVDAFDGHPPGNDQPHNGASWVFDRADPQCSAAPHRCVRATDSDGETLAPRVGWSPDGLDEHVVLDGRALAEVIGHWARRSEHMHFGPFLSALAITMREHGVPGEHICHLFALHSSTRSCDELIDVSTIEDSVVPTAPESLDVRFEHPHAGRPRAVLEWRDANVLSDGFRVAFAPPESPETSASIPWSASAEHHFEVPFDEPVEFSVRGTYDGREGPAIARIVQTPAEAPRGVAAMGHPGGVQLDWEPVRASRYLLRMVWPVRRDVLFTADTSAFVPGLAAGVDYRFELLSLNAEGDASPHGAGPVSASPEALDPESDEPPEVRILVPEAGLEQRYDGFDEARGQWYAEVDVEAFASDLEDGLLDEGAVVWSTDRTDVQPAVLGTGARARVRLFSDSCFGADHVLTVTVTDSDGNVSEDRVRVRIWQLC